MHWLLYSGLIVVTFLVMELITWLTHKFVMHGFLWYLHEDHHQKQDSTFEKNDAFFAIFAVPCFLILLYGTIENIYWLQAVGFGVMAYGFAYFIVHDVIIHQRLKWFTHSNNSYIRAIRWAHKMHHKHLDRHDGESFGMLWVHKKYRAKIKRNKIAQQAKWSDITTS